MMPTAEPSHYVVLTAGSEGVTIPAGTRFRRSTYDDEPEILILETREDVVLPARRSTEIPLFTIGPINSSQRTTLRTLSDYSGSHIVRDRRWLDTNLGVDLTGVTFQLVPRWTPLSERTAREGFLRLLARRIETQPRRWWERL